MKRFAFIVLLLSVSIANAQQKDQQRVIESVLKKIRLLNLDAIKLLDGESLEKESASELLKYNSILSEHGYFANSSVVRKPIEKKIDTSILALNKLNLGLYDLLYSYNTEDESLSHLNEALKIALKIKNRPLICEIIKSILIYHDRLLIVEDYPKYYLDTYNENLYDITENQIYKILKADLGFVGDNFIHEKDVILEILEMAPNLDSQFYKALAYKIAGKFYDIAESDYEMSLLYHTKALKFLGERDEGLFNTLREKVEINMAVVEYLQGKFPAVLNRLQKIENEYEGKTNNYLNNFKFIWISNAQKQLGQLDQAYHNLEKSRLIRNKLNQTYHSSKVAKLRMDLESDKKDDAINQLSLEKSNLRTKLLALLPVLGIITFAAIVGLFLFKKYKSRNSKLETEKSETLQKLDELKNIVIKNHIILKDKTKVYISDLMYIKSDDHYLNVYTSDDKNHFVRGKLSTIREELPPNFIQCHRSYIVNSNFIKRINNDSITLVDKTQVPLSRSFKNKF